MKNLIPDVVYRLRRYSAVSLKELLYGEAYFSAARELTDPYDTKVYYRFSGNRDRYRRLLTYLISPFLPKGKALDCGEMADTLSGTDLSYEELVEAIRSPRFQKMLFRETCLAYPIEGFILYQKILDGLFHEIHKHMGRNSYVVSFTGNLSDPTVWSTHSDNHSGFALVIEPYQDKLVQNPLRRKPKAQSDDGSIRYLDSMDYPFQKVTYVGDIKSLNAFYSFPQDVYGQEVPEQGIKEYWSQYRLLATTKYATWTFENEYRLVDLDWMPDHVNQDGPVLRHSVDRLYYYDQTQLKGVVCGMNMRAPDREELIRTAVVMRDRLFWETRGILPIFGFYHARPSHSEYKIVIDPPFLALDYNNRQFDPDQWEQKEQELKAILGMWKKSTSFKGTDHVVYRR